MIVPTAFNVGGYGRSGKQGNGTATNNRSPDVREGRTFAGDSTTRKFRSMTRSVSFPTGMTHYRLERSPDVISDLVGIIRISHLQRRSSTVGWMGGRWEQLYELRLNKSSRALSVSPFGQGHMAHVSIGTRAER